MRIFDIFMVNNIYILYMDNFSHIGFSAAIVYGLALGAVSLQGNENLPKPENTVAKDSAKLEAPIPGSEGDTLTLEDKRMAYLIYKLLDSDGKIKGANMENGAKLFFQNCRPCHGEDGRRINFNPAGAPEYIGKVAREEMPSFWAQMNFGDEIRGMEAYYDEFTLDELRDIAGYAQTLR